MSGQSGKSFGSNLKWLLLICAATGAEVQAQSVENNIDTKLVEPDYGFSTMPVVESGEEAVQLAYHDNPLLLAERARTRAADEEVVQARSAYGPSLNFDGSYLYSYDEFELASGSNQSNSGWAGTASLLLSQPIYSSGRLKSAEQAAYASVAFARQTTRYQESQTLLNVFSSYLQVQRDRYLLLIAKRNLELLMQQERDGARRFNVREITRTDLNQIQTRLGIAEARVYTSQSDLGRSESAFVNVVGGRPGNLRPLQIPGLMPTTFEGVMTIASNDNPLLRVAYARERGSRARIEQALAERGPDISLEARASYGGITPYSNDLNQKSVGAGVAVTMPLYDSGNRASRIREARELNLVDQHLRDQAFRDVRDQALTNWNIFVSRREQLADLRSAVLAARNAYDGSLRQLRAGLATTFDTLTLLRDLLDVQQQYAIAWTEGEAARYSLLAVMGRLEGPNLQDDIVAYRPAEHLAKVDNKGDTPIVTQIVRTVDGVTVSGTQKAYAYPDGIDGIDPFAMVPTVPVSTPSGDFSTIAD